MDAYTNLGILLNGLNRAKEAAECFCKAITLRPKHPDARRLLALAHCMIGEVDEAVKILREWLAEDPGDPIAEHMLAASTGSDVPLRASNAFVEKTFDAFAQSFEVKLQSLSYRAPSSSRPHWPTPIVADGQLEILDIGCGTGLPGRCSAVRVATHRRRPVCRDAAPMPKRSVYRPRAARDNWVSAHPECCVRRYGLGRHPGVFR